MMFKISFYGLKKKIRNKINMFNDLSSSQKTELDYSEITSISGSRRSVETSLSLVHGHAENRSIRFYGILYSTITLRCFMHNRFVCTMRFLFLDPFAKEHHGFQIKHYMIKYDWFTAKIHVNFKWCLRANEHITIFVKQ